MLNKGFIGPVGDDLPSLTPLIFGLIMFFSSFTVAFNSFDTRNAEFNQNIDLIKISKSMQANGYIYSYENFDSLCDNIGSTNLSYVAAITSDAYTPKKAAAELRNQTIFDLQFFSSGGKSFYCTNVDATGSKFSDIVKLEEISDKKIASRIYPIVVEDERIVKPMHLVVIAWK